ncbi:MAG: phosphonoacetaldehyde reductase [Candidatus Hodarchaeales archaeon]
MHQQEFIGKNSSKELKRIIRERNPGNIFLVTGKKSYSLCGAEKLIKKSTGDITVTKFSEFANNPEIEDIRKGIDLFREKEHEITIAIGGGSVMDMAKLVNAFATQKEDPIKYITKESTFTGPLKPLIAIPTTSGSGSEATHFAVVYVDKIKYSVTHELLLPEYVIVDPVLTMNLPKKITATTGLDALCQAIESFWSVNSTEESKKYSREAVRLVLANLVRAVHQPDEDNRMVMARAANLAGKAINISKTTASHALSYTFTSYYGIPHGHAVALTLGEVLLFNSQVNQNDVLDKRGLEHVINTMEELYSMLGCNDALSCKKRIQELLTSCDLEINLADLGIDYQEALELVSNNVNIERLSNNPRKVNKTDIEAFVTSIR